MQTNFALLVHMLRTYDETLRSHQGVSAFSGILRTKPVRILPTDFECDTLYTIHASDLPVQAPDGLCYNLLCFSDSATPDWINSQKNINLIVVSSSVTEDQVTAALYKVFQTRQRFSDALEQITNALYYGQGLQAIVDMGAELFGNPMFILDSSFSALAISKTVPIKNPAIKADTEQGYLDRRTINYLQSRGWLKALRENGNIVFFSPEEYSDYVGGSSVHQWCYCYVKINGVVAAYINIFGENAPLMEYHKDWISKLAQLVSIELQKDPKFLNNQGAMYEALLTDLLEKRITDQLVVLRRLDLLQRTLGKNLWVVTVRKRAWDSKPFTSIEQDRIRSLFPHSISVAYGQDTVLLVSSDGENIPIRDNLETLDHDFAASGLISGISNCFTDITDMRRYYLQSLKALEFGTSIFSTGNVFRYVDYAIYHALELSTLHTDLRDFCHPGVLKLRESSSPGDRELYQTLYLYLLYMKDTSKVTESLNISRSTLFYRLNKFREMTGLDYDNGNDIFQLMLAFKLEEYMDIFAPSKTPLPPIN